MSSGLMGYFWLAVLCAPGIVPAIIFYERHCKKKPGGEGRFPLGLYVAALLICAFVAFWADAEWGVRFACRSPSSGNLCGLLGLIIVGPLGSIIAVSVLSWLVTYFPSQAKLPALVGVVLFVLAAGYHFRGLFFDSEHRTLYQYTLQSSNLDELHRFAPVVEAKMQRLPALNNVSLDSQIQDPHVIVNIDPRKVAAPGVMSHPTATMTISFRLAPGVELGDAVAQIQDMTSRLALPASITTSLAKAPIEPRPK